MIKCFRWFAVAVLATASVASAQVERNGALPALFPRTNWWNTDISRAPVDPNSSAYIAFIGADKGMHPDFGGDAGGTAVYGFPYVVVSGSQPLVPVTFQYASESDSGAPGRPVGYPIPPQIITEGKWIEGGYPAGDATATGDRHLLIVDRDNRFLYELYAARYNNTLKRWEAGSGAVYRLNSNKRRPDRWTSADAAGLALLPGLVRYEEAFNSGPIRHAFRVTMRATNGYVFPASHGADTTAGALPNGARLRLKATKDISGYPAYIQRIFQAMKTYGVIVADNGADMSVSGTYDTRWDNAALNPAFAALKASDFEVVRLGWRPTTDLNADGRTDIIWRNRISGANATWLMNGTRLGSVTDLAALPNNAFSIAASGDFDRDGKTDLVLRNQNTGQNAIWRLNGSQLVGVVDLPLLTNAAFRFAGSGDFDGDDQPDLVLRNSVTGQNAIWLMNGTALKTVVDLPMLPDTNYVIGGVGDFNYDGENDIVFRNKMSGQNAVWLLRGTSFVGVRDLPALPNGSYAIGGVGDVDGDFSADILWRNEVAGTNAAWLMNGTTLRAVADLPALPDTSWSMSGPR